MNEEEGRDGFREGKEREGKEIVNEVKRDESIEESFHRVTKWKKE